MIFDPIGALFYLVCITFGQCTDAQCGVITGVIVAVPSVLLLQLVTRYVVRGVRAGRVAA